MLYEKVLRYAVLAVSKNKIEGESNLLRVQLQQRVVWVQVCSFSS